MIKDFLLRQVRFKTLSVSFNVITSVFLLSNASFLKYLIALVIGFLLQGLANIFNSFQTEVKSASSRNLIYLLLACLLLLGGVASGTNIYLWAVGLLAILIVFSYSYKGARWRVRVSETPLADIFIILSFGPLATYGAAEYFGVEHITQIAVLSILNGILAHNLLWIHRIKDIDKDLSAGKKTLAVLLGKDYSLVLMMLENLYAIHLVYQNFGVLCAGLILGIFTLIISLIKFNNFYYAFHFWILFLLMNPFVLKLYAF